MIRNAELYDSFTCNWDLVNFAIKDGIILGTGNYSGIREIDCKGARVVPGLIDSHVHIETPFFVRQNMHAWLPVMGHQRLSRTPTK